MSTTFAFLALSGLLSAVSPPAELAFQKEYTHARQIGKEQSKPLAVIIGAGEAGWGNVCRDEMNGDVKKLLAENYVCVYVNRGDEAGKRLAADFEVTDGPAMIISDRTGDLQAFRHSGQMSNEAMGTQLRRFADTNVVVKHTETLTPAHTSMYPANGQAAAGTIVCQGGRCAVASSGRQGGSCGTYAGGCSTGSCGTQVSGCNTGGCGSRMSGCNSGRCGGGSSRGCRGGRCR